MALSPYVSSALPSGIERLSGGARDYDRLLERTKNARLVLIGEATHGTHEFYAERARITQRLIQEQGFHAVAVEADWPDAYRVNRHVRGIGDDSAAVDALGGFKRFPTWMWRNADVLEFIGWLAEHNRSADQQVGFYGLDLYSLYSSIEAIIGTLERIAPEAARRARERYGCFDHFHDDAERYAYIAGMGLDESCEREVTEQLLELQRAAEREFTQHRSGFEDELFYVEQNARLVKNAEEYYRNMFGGRVNTWNLRDRHMIETLIALAEHLDRKVGTSKIVVWAHNSHLGDARATGMGQIGEWNVGQLARERFPHHTFLLGFTTYSGTVSAASDWGEPVERKTVRPALPGSYEALFHELATPRFLHHLGESAALGQLPRSSLERAIGVIYRPQTERASHYFRAELASQFDAVIHIDHTRALEPLETTAEWHDGEAPETYPSAV